MNTLSLTRNGYFLKFFEFLSTHPSGTSTPLQEDSSNQETVFFTQRTQALRQLQQTYYLERRCFL